MLAVWAPGGQQVLPGRLPVELAFPERPVRLRQVWREHLAPLAWAALATREWSHSQVA